MVQLKSGNCLKFAQEWNFLTHMASYCRLAQTIWDDLSHKKSQLVGFFFQGWDMFLTFLSTGYLLMFWNQYPSFPIASWSLQYHVWGIVRFFLCFSDYLNEIYTSQWLTYVLFRSKCLMTYLKNAFKSTCDELSISNHKNK